MSVRTTRRNPSGIAFLIILFMAAAASGDDAKKTAWAPRPKSASNAEGSGAGKTDSLPSGAVARLGHVRLRHSDRRIDQLAFAPDGRLVASTGGGPIKLWDTSTGTLVRQLAGHAGPVGLRTSSVAFSPDGKLLASGGYGWTAAIWDVETGKERHLLRTHRFGRLGAIRPIHVAFAAGGESLITGGVEGVVQVWDVSTGQELRKFDTAAGSGVSRQRASVTALAVSPDGKTATVSVSGMSILLLDLTAGNPPKKVAVASYAVHDLEYSPDGTTLAWCGASRSKEKLGPQIVLWDLANNRQRLQLPGHNGDTTSGIDFSPDGRRLVSSGNDNSVKLWDLTTAEQLWTTAEHVETPCSVAFSPDGKTIASGSVGGLVRLWDSGTGREVLSNQGVKLTEIVGLSISPAGQTVLTAHNDRAIRLWDLGARRVKHTFRVEGDLHDDRGGVAFSSDGRVVAVAHDATVDMWDIASGRRLWSRDEFHRTQKGFDFKSPGTSTLAFSENGKRLISKTDDRRDSGHKRTILRIWDVNTGRLLTQINRPARVWARPLLSNDGRKVIFNEYVEDDQGTKGKAVCFHDAATGKLLHRLQAQGISGQATLALSPDEEMIATGSSHSRILFWDATSGDFLFTLQGPRFEAVLTVLAFSPDGAQIAAASRHGTQAIHVWEIAGGRLTHEFRVGTEHIRFSRDGKKLLAGQPDGTVLVWDLTSATSDLQTGETLTLKEIQQRWVRLAYQLDSSRGSQAIHDQIDALVEGGDQTVALLQRELLRPAADERDRKEAGGLVISLTDADREVRERARCDIEKFGDVAWRVLKDVDVSESPVSTVRLKAIEAVLAQCLRHRRDDMVYRVLGQIATPRARRLLQRVAEELEDRPENTIRRLRAEATLDQLEKLSIRRTD